MVDRQPNRLRPPRLLLPVLAVITLLGCHRETSRPGSDSIESPPRSARSSLPQPAASNSPEAATPVPATATAAPTPDRGEQIARVGRHLKAGQIDQARQILRSLILAKSDDYEAVFLLARCEAAEGNLTAAVELLNDIPDDHPQAGLPALGQAADWSLQQGDRQAAADRYERILSVHGDVLLAHRRLAKIRSDRGERFAARRHLRFLLDAGDMTLDEIIAINCISSPFYDAENFPPVQGGHSMTDLTHARQFFLDEDFEAAGHLTTELAGRFPNNVEVHAFLGRVLNGLQDDAALQRWAENLPPGIDQHPEYWLAVGEWLLRSGEYEQATRALCESVRRDPTNRATYGLLSTCLIALDQPDLAEAASQRYSLLHEMAVALWHVNSPEATAADYQTLADKLMQLRRPKEALMWRVIAAGQSQRGRQQIPELQAEFQRIVSGTEVRPDSWELCGINLDDYPLPDALPELHPRPRRQRSNPPIDVQLVDVADRVGLKFQFRQSTNHDYDQLKMYQIMGGGVAAADFDRDGWCDLYFTQAESTNPSGRAETNQLFRNLGGDRFVSITDQAGVGDTRHGQGVTAADLNQDGFPDYVVANLGTTFVYFNNGDGTFRRSASLLPNDDNRWSTSVGAGDLDGDSLPDLVVANYINDPNIWVRSCFGPEKNCNPRLHQAAADDFFRMSPEGDLQPMETETSERLFSLGVLIGNLDGEAGNDVFLANDTDVNQLWVSRRAAGGSFTLHEEALPRGVAATSLGDAPGCMGIAQGDFDRNGTLDLHITNFASESSNLYLQNERGLFFEKAALFGLREVTYPMVGFGTQAVDFNHDGWLDLAVVNGHVTNYNSPAKPYQMPPQLFRGTGDSFELVGGEAASDEYWSTPKLGRALAQLDWDRDGRMDLVASHLDVPAALLQNRSDAPNWVQFELVGIDSERDAVGARIELTCGDETWTRWVTGGDGFQCRNEALIHVGLGEAVERIDRVDVIWPNGRRQSVSDLPANRRWLIIEGDAEPFER